MTILKLSALISQKTGQGLGEIDEVLDTLSDLLYKQFIDNDWCMDESATGIDTCLYNHGKLRAKPKKKKR